MSSSTFDYSKESGREVTAGVTGTQTEGRKGGPEREKEGGAGRDGGRGATGNEFIEGGTTANPHKKC